MESKFVKHSYYSIGRNSKPLDLIHIDIQSQNYLMVEKIIL